ncbi:MAG: DNA translocase FtsK 4TM domain-containing protein [Candidatus Neomarinimicrobiota bacterium]
MENDRRLEILGILMIALSVFILVSLLGYNSSEEPSISPNIQIDNPMGILGLITSYVFIKKGFGYVTILLPMVGIAWGWFLFSKKQLETLIRTSIHLLFLMVLLSISIAVGSILILDQSPNRYYLSGQIGGNLGDFFLDWLKIWGTIILLITSYLILISTHRFKKSLPNWMNERRELLLKKIERIKKRQSESTHKN